MEFKFIFIIMFIFISLKFELKAPCVQIKYFIFIIFFKYILACVCILDGQSHDWIAELSCRWLKFAGYYHFHLSIHNDMVILLLCTTKK